MTLIVPTDIGDAYFVIGDRNPTTDLWSTQANGFVPHASAGAWLTSGHAGFVRSIVSAQDDGTGKLLLNVVDGANVQVGQRIRIQDTASYDGNFIPSSKPAPDQIVFSAINYIPGASITGGTIRGAAYIATEVELHTFLNLIAIQQSRPDLRTITGSATVVLTNPIARYFSLLPTGGACALQLPEMNSPFSVPVGQIIRFANISPSFSVQLKLFDGTNTFIVGPNEVHDLVLTANDLITGSGRMLNSQFKKIATDGRAITVTFTPFGALVATNVQTAIEELDTEKADATATTNALALKAPLASPSFTGNPLAPTPSAGDNDTSIATTAFVTAAVAASGAGLASFSAHKNGTDQTGILTATATKLTFGTESYDVGSFYDTTNSKWTPPAGKVQISATVYVTAGIVDQQQFQLFLYKNGAFFKSGLVCVGSGTTPAGAFLNVTDAAGGTDYYELYFIGQGAGNKTVDGQSYNSYFQGTMQ